MDILFKAINVLGGVSLVITAIVGYFGKLYIEKFKSNQDATNKELQAKIDATSAGLKSKLEKSVHVTKSYFDKEFLAYSEIWGLMFSLKEHTVSLRPVLEYVDATETLDERKSRRLKAFTESFNSLVRRVESNRPFIPIEIYENIRAFQIVCRKESIGYEHGNPYGDGMSYWGESEENVAEIIRMLDVVCEDIRSRLHNLSVIE